MDGRPLFDMLNMTANGRGGSSYAPAAMPRTILPEGIVEPEPWYYTDHLLRDEGLRMLANHRSDFSRQPAFLWRGAEREFWCASTRVVGK